MHSANNTQKKMLRKGLTAKRFSFWRENPLDWAAWSRSAQVLVRESAQWRKAQTVGLYMPIRGEVDLCPLIAEAMAEGRTVLLPRCRPQEMGVMDFVRVESTERLVPGAYNILEPDADCPVLDAPPDLLLVPCVGMDRSGLRLGYGGGYYDRHLARPDWQGVARLGVLFSFQLVEHLPHDNWDAGLSGWVSEKEIVWL